jgi:tetratricopeptide (TPR) repeat protein
MLIITFAGAALTVGLLGCGEQQVDRVQLFLVQAIALGDLERGRLPEAEERFKQIIALAPRDPAGYANLGITFLRGGRFEEAETQLRRAQRLDPTDVHIGLSLARVYAASGRSEQARAKLAELLARQPDNVQVLYALAELDAAQGDSNVDGDSEERLRRIVALRPNNLAARVGLLDALARRGEADSVVGHLEDIRRIGPEPPSAVREVLEQTVQLFRAGQSTDGRAALRRFSHLIALTAPYQATLDELKWLEGPLVGRPVVRFRPESLHMLELGGGSDRELVRFTDATVEVGLPDAWSSVAAPVPAAAEEASTALAVGDYDDDDATEVFVSIDSPNGGARRTHMYHWSGGQFLDQLAATAIPLPDGSSHARFADWDNDGRLDLFVIGTDGRGRLLHNREAAGFADVTASAGLGDAGSMRRALFVDMDHDGDLDLVLVGPERLRAYRNNLDGSFTEVAADIGLAAARRTRDAAFADFDGDGRLDLFVATDSGGDQLYRNMGARRFEDVAAASGIDRGRRSGSVVVGDYDNDGLLDIFSAAVNGGPPVLWRSRTDGTFTRDDRSADAFAQVRAVAVVAAEFVDYDNDGWLDLVILGRPRSADRSARGLWLFRNDGTGRFRERSSALPGTVGTGSAFAVSDVDNDGDQDLLIAEAGGLRLLRNEGGNANLSAQIRLMALRTGSGKNNSDGIGARIELRAGEIYQTRVVTNRVTHFGLGPHLKADVLRVQWPNGLPQTVYFPGTDQDVVEAEALKGSCAFLYTWDGERFRFITDVMWRSALGMPLGIMGGGATAWAPAGASQEYLRIPGDALQPRGGRYIIQLTEELWETAYVDEVRLLAVDHPDSVEVFVDERFVPPAPVDLRFFKAVQRHPPVSAVDVRGADVLPALLYHDDLYVSNLTPLGYQGLVEPHDVVLDLGEDAGQPGTYLFLRGWIYPTDASINVALSQQSRLSMALPRLDVRDGKGGWVTAIADLGFPSGKDKTIVLDLAGLFPTEDHRVRVRTNMQIYWGHAFVARHAADSPVRVTQLQTMSADLHYRGFSRMYRRGGRYGPHWFAYDEVTRESPWRTIEGRFTRFGGVQPLVGKSDDEYVIMGPGDETTVAFDGSTHGTLAPGWKRTFLLYTDGWIKDADLNTAFGNTVEPLPFHGIRQYPYAPAEAYPPDGAHRRYLEEYNTRVVTRRQVKGSGSSRRRY